MNRRSQPGFTLVELLATLAVAATLALVAVPGLQQTLQRTRLAQAHNTLLGTLQQARNLAVLEGTTTLVCPSRDRQHCQPSPQWHEGWLVARDADRDGQPDAGPWRVHAAALHRVRIISTRGRQSIRFQADGSAGGNNLTLVLCSAGDPASARTIVLSNPGRPRRGNATPAQAASCAAS